MASKVSVSSTSSSNSANRAAESSGTRNRAPGSSDFSTALNAAAAKPSASHPGNPGSQDTSQPKSGGQATDHRSATDSNSVSAGSKARPAPSSQAPDRAATSAKDANAKGASGAADAGKTGNAPPQSGAQSQQTAQAQTAQTNQSAQAGQTAQSQQSQQAAIDAIITAADDASAQSQTAVQDDGATDGSAVPRGTKSKTADATVAAGSAAAMALLVATNALQVNEQTGTSQSGAGGNDGQEDTGDDHGGGSTPSDAIAAASVAAAAMAGSLASNPLGAAAAVPAQVAGGSSTGMSVTDANAKGAGQDVQNQNALLMTLDSLVGANAADSPANATTGAAPGSDNSGNGSSATPSINTAPAALSELVSRMSATPGPAVAERSISVPVSDRGWSNEVATQVQWMVNSHVQSATLKLSPEHLGPLEVHIDMQSTTQVNVSFTALHPDTRSALEQSVPALRQLMASGGLTLGQTSVQQENRSTPGYAPGVSRGAISAAHSVDSLAVSTVRMLGLVDEYA